MTDRHIKRYERACAKLDEFGADNIIKLISNGGRLLSHAGASEAGILNEIDVTEQQFVRWLSEQDISIQNDYHHAVSRTRANMTTEVIHESLSTIRSMQELIDKNNSTDRAPPKKDAWTLKLLQAKDASSSALLRNLIAMNKNDPTQSAIIQSETEKPTKSDDSPSGSVVITQEQAKIIDGMKND